jgi:hypothetical protein
MSRTYRRKDLKADSSWLYTEVEYNFTETGHWYRWGFHRVPVDRTTKEFKKELARYHSDTYSNCKEPGPAWFRLLHTERPQRREAKRQLRNYIQDIEYVVILNAKDPLEYWT